MNMKFLVSPDLTFNWATSLQTWIGRFRGESEPLLERFQLGHAFSDMDSEIERLRADLEQSGFNWATSSQTWIVNDTTWIDGDDWELQLSHVLSDMDSS